MFRQYGRINYKDYLRSIRFEHALRELEETDLTIGEIALKNGFPNSQAFSRLFREKYGILPTEYQRRQKENDSAAFLMIQIQAESSLLGRLWYLCGRGKKGFSGERQTVLSLYS